MSVQLAELGRGISSGGSTFSWYWATVMQAHRASLRAYHAAPRDFNFLPSQATRIITTSEDAPNERAAMLRAFTLTASGGKAI